MMKNGTSIARATETQSNRPGTTRARPRETAIKAVRTASSGVTTKAGMASTWDALSTSPGRCATA